MFFAVNGHPGHAFESKVCNIQYMPRLPCFETMQKQTEKFKLHVECPKFKKVDVCQPVICLNHFYHPLVL
jgi:hypothetical protein